MDRRSFLWQSALTGIAVPLLPQALFSQETVYSIFELMGKSEIDLYGKDINLRKEACEAYLKMRDAAKADGIDIKIVSSFRNFERQKAIFERKYERYTEEEGLAPLEAIDKIILYSTIPGTSRHHWGTDIDIIQDHVPVEGDVLVPEKFGQDGPFEELKTWMDANSEDFGFYLVYTDNPKRRGFKYEPWHYSYAPIAIPMLTEFRKKNIMALLQEENFAGVEHMTTGFINSYIRDNILDINPALL